MRCCIKYIFLLSLAAFVLYGCGEGARMQSIKRAYSLMDTEDMDSIEQAEIILSSISSKDLNEKENAHYCLSLTRVLYLLGNETQDDSLINISIRYFSKKKDKYHLSESYYYKGSINSENTQDMIDNFKEAEMHALEIEDLNTKFKIEESLYVITNHLGLTNESGKYAMKAYNIARQADNKDWTAFSMIYLANYYRNKGMQDSCQYYVEQCKPYMKYIKKQNQDTFFMLLSNNTFDEDLSTEYSEKAFKLNQHPGTCLTLSSKYMTQKRYEEAESLLNEGLTMARLRDSIQLISKLTELKKLNNYYEDACSLYTLNEELRKRYNEDKINKSLMNLRLQYDMTEKERKFHKLIHIVAFVGVLTLLGILAYIIFNRLRIAKMREGLLKDHLLIELYNKQISELEKQKNISSEHVEELMDKVNKLQEKQVKLFHSGMKLYNHLTEGGTIVKWSKQDYDDFLDYYNFIDMPFMMHLDKDYDNLPSRSKLYLILEKMNKKDDEIAQVFGVSQSSIRSMRSRIKSRKLN